MRNRVRFSLWSAVAEQSADTALPLTRALNTRRASRIEAAKGNSRLSAEARCQFSFVLEGFFGAHPILSSSSGCGGARTPQWLIFLFFCCFSLLGCTSKPYVVLYCAQDQVYAEPILAEFTAATGIEVRAVYDSEAVKSVGLANRILSEREHPIADVFWGNEEFQTRRLVASGVFRETNGWATCGERSRRLVATEEHRELTKRDLPSLTNSDLRGHLSIAAPWFGSTATHFAALRAEWGKVYWRTWCQGLAENRVFLEEGNSQVIKRVARGEAWLGLTDSDDIQAAQREGLKLVAGPALQPLRNTVGVLRGSLHPDRAEKLFNYLQSPEVQEKLIRAGAIESRSAAASSAEARWGVMIRDFETASRDLRQAFTR